jgi:hypothetical protein
MVHRLVALSLLGECWLRGPQGRILSRSTRSATEIHGGKQVKRFARFAALSIGPFGMRVAFSGGLLVERILSALTRTAFSVELGGSWCAP